MHFYLIAATVEYHRLKMIFLQFKKHMLIYPHCWGIPPFETSFNNLNICTQSDG